MLDSLIQATPAHESLFGRFTGLMDALDCDESDAGCARRGHADRILARNTRHCTSDVEQSSREALHVLPSAHRGDDLHRPLGPIRATGT